MSGHNAQSVSAGLRSATAVAHDRAERAHFVDDLMSGRLDAAGYLRMAVQLYFIYRALESVGDELSGEEVAGAVVDERLRRLPRLTADLAALGVDPTTITPLPGVTAYVAAIERTRTDPVRFVAHHYTRYLGDLSGGQVIRSRMKLHYGLTDDALSFYVFDEIDKLKRYKDTYRDTLDGLPLDDHQVRILLDEAVRAFEHNEQMFAELAGH
ncbi:biliverdin-producing heme oxygenase [Gordonia sp. Z-3]|uniref:biliverdin-producing heme oxygenase n=1 Tax=unclassified Gordonia (in: high G+C Gram-positive bacteria) TaxID=2657482 RepID=UPI000C3B1C87|nr:MULTISPECIES: biliverdin-producing heme oxygenase [unclassified Gordonia (in: high G+C Gram-positive bacteria)]MAU84609.1 biliverdin-producing heme oxygenase [Gordonia sp. (in: high G+C Gram-positive bacteria)]MED5801000.1 biliverdin-producing heme oxygenase [Gordonia sp. Z-3]